MLHVKEDGHLVALDGCVAADEGEDERTVLHLVSHGSPCIIFRILSPSPRSIARTRVDPADRHRSVCLCITATMD